jgi:microcystin-dependent protein
MFTEYTGVLTLPATTNPDVPPAAYIEYRLILPVDVDILLTSFQLIIGDFEVKYEYLQDTVDRQIDQTYHTAYPIVPIGTVIDYFGFPTPAHYLLCDGTAVSRTTYNQLFDVLTNIETVTLTSGMPTFTVANGAIYAVGTPIEGAGVTPGTTIMSISTNTITMSANATASGAKALRFFAVGEGDGSTTFNVPDLRGEVLAGSGGTLLAASKGTGTTGGASTVTLDIASMPAHTHNSVAGNFIVTAGGMADLVGGGGIGTQGQTASTGGDGAHNNVQPTTLAGKWIRFE